MIVSWSPVIALVVTLSASAAPSQTPTGAPSAPAGHAARALAARGRASLAADCGQDKLTASDATAVDRFGLSVSIAGDVALVGAPYEDAGGMDAGAAYVYRFDGTAWPEESKLVASDAGADDRFGASVATSGAIAVVGATRDDDGGTEAGAAYIFRHDGTAWVQEAKLVAATARAFDLFGWSVAVAGDLVVVGDLRDNDRRGSAYVYRYDGTNWGVESRLTASDGAADDEFGWSVAIDGDVILVGAHRDDDASLDVGSAYVFRFDGSRWNQESRLSPSDATAGDESGFSVAVSGDYALVGAPYHDAAGGRQDAGSAAMYHYDGTRWAEDALWQADVPTGFDTFGRSVALAGSLALVGCRSDDDLGADSGSTYLLRHEGAAWLVESKLTASDGAAGDVFGSSVVLSGNLALIGANGDDDGGSESGSAYVLQLPPCTTIPLLRDDTVTDLSPLTPSLATLLPLDPVVDIHVPSFASGDLDPDTGVLDDATRPLVLYAVDAPVVIYVLVAPGRQIRIVY